MSEATTPANTTDQIAATTATRGDIASHEGDATIPAVAPDAQHSARNEARLALHLLDRVWRGKDVDVPDDYDPEVVVAAYIERLEAERDALLAEHEEGSACGTCGNVRSTVERANATYVCKDPWHTAHDNVERVIHGE